MTTICHVVGARPNFVKMAPVIAALERTGSVRQELVHTGQHYDARLSDIVMANVGMPPIDHMLGIGSGTHGSQTGRALVAFEEVLLESPPDAVVVAGDVNSTLACALAAAKLGIPVAHVEAGLRSFDWSMPEEINRVLTDRLSDLLFTHSPEAAVNLSREGVASERVHYVGNTMIDTLRLVEPEARALRAWEEAGVAEGEYVLVTLHRPSNVDEPDRLKAIADALVDAAARAPVVFPVHPRTAARLDDVRRGEALRGAGVRLIDPVGYVEFVSLQCGAGAVLTDSGGIQEETSALGIPCYTLRPNTERPVTIELGTNTLLGDDPAAIAGVEIRPQARIPADIPLWDGHAGRRIADVLVAAFAEPAARSTAA